MIQNRKHILTTTLLGAITAFGLATFASQALAVGLANGDYTIYIRQTPISGGNPIFGSDPNWNSSFTFGGNAPGLGSNYMPDTGALGQSGRGSGISGDTIPGLTLNNKAVGRIGIRVNSNAISITSFSKDLIPGTAGGDFVQYYSPTVAGPDASAGVTGAGSSGTVDPATGKVTLSLVGRMGAITNPPMTDNRWNFDDNCNTGLTVFSTESASTLDPLCGPVKATINGVPLTSLGDINSDGVEDFRAILVSGGNIGNDWGSFAGANYFEVWNVRIVSSKLVADTATTSINTPITVSVLTNDTGLAPLTVSGAANGTSGTVTFTAGDVTYTPNLGFTGADSFTYTVLDGNGETKTGGTVNVTVQAAGAPLTTGDTATTNQNTGVAIAAGSNDTVSNTPATYAILSVPTNGNTVVTNAGTGAMTYTPNAGFVGNDSFTYRITDAATLTGDGTVTITVNPFGLTSSGAYAPGSLAVSSGSTNGALSLNDVQADTGVVDQCVGGCFDFVVTGATSPLQVVLPRLLGSFTAQNITDGLRYRKYIGGAWRNFDASAGDEVASQPLTAGGGCPLPGAGGWKSWANGDADNSHAGDQCIRLTIADNGPNDGNSTLGTIADPGGAGVGIPVSTVVERNPVLNDFVSDSNGCSLSAIPSNPTEGSAWALVLGFLAWLKALAWRRKRDSSRN